MLTLADMAATFKPAVRARRSLVGFEYETQLFDRATLSPLTLEGSPGVQEILRTLEAYGTRKEPPLYSKLDLTDGGQISFEPGGQLEFSSEPRATFKDCLSELNRFLSLIKLIEERHHVHAFFGGANPLHTVDEIGLVVPTERYKIMNEYFPRVGTMGRRMMRQTCSFQLTFDYRDQNAGLKLLRAAQCVAPIAAAIFANSPYIDGRRTEYRSYRTPIWQDTDRRRIGALPGLGRDDYRFSEYTAHIIKAPMFFVETPNGLVNAQGLTFAEFNEKGFLEQKATIDSFVLHNTTIFTDTRLKQTIELRSIDGQDPADVPSVIAFVCGLLLCERARTRTLEELGIILECDYARLSMELARSGLRGAFYGRPLREVAASLVEVASEGINDCFADGAFAQSYLKKLHSRVKAGMTPADLILERFGDARSWLAAGRISPASA